MRPRWPGRHASDHFDCVTDRDCDGLDEPGIGHICNCSCRRCSIVVGQTNGLGRYKRIEVCICRDCDVAACGLHNASPE